MHIGFLTPEYPHPEFKRSGGLGTSIKNLVAGLVAHNVSVTVFIIGQEKDTDLKDECIRLLGIAKQKHVAFNWYLERKRYQKIIQNHINTDGIQLIEAPDWTGLSAFMKFTVPLIIRLNGSDGYFCHLEERPQKWKNRFLERNALKNANALVAVSAFTAQLSKAVFGLKTAIDTIHNSIDTDCFKPLNVAINPGQLLYYGTLIRKKGVLELATIFNKVVEKLPKSNLLLIGKDAIDIFENTSTLQLFEALLSPAAKERLTYIEELPYSQVKQYIASSQIVVLPSFAEAFPMTWLESLAMEKALVSSNVGWANELMIDGVTGYTVNPKNHELYAEKVIELLQNVSKCTQFGKAGRRHVIDHFSTSLIVKQNMEFYNTIIKG